MIDSILGRIGLMEDCNERIKDERDVRAGRKMGS